MYPDVLLMDDRISCTGRGTRRQGRPVKNETGGRGVATSPAGVWRENQNLAYWSGVAVDAIGVVNVVPVLSKKIVPRVSVPNERWPLDPADCG